MQIIIARVSQTLNYWIEMHSIVHVSIAHVLFKCVHYSNVLLYSKENLNMARVFKHTLRAWGVFLDGEIPMGFCDVPHVGSALFVTGARTCKLLPLTRHLLCTSVLVGERARAHGRMNEHRDAADGGGSKEANLYIYCMSSYMRLLFNL